MLYVTSPHLTSSYLAFLQVGPASTVGFPSLMSHLASQELVHHIHVLPARMAGPPAGQRHNFTGLTTQLPCDVHLLNLRTLQSTSQSTHTALLLHRLGVDCRFPTYGVTCQCSSSKVRCLQGLSQKHIWQS